MIDIEKIKRNFGRKFKLKRQEIGYSQAELTEQLDMESQNFISNFENGKKDISFSTFFKACKVLNSHPFEFFLTPAEKYDNALDERIELIKMIENMNNDEVKCLHTMAISINKLTSNKI